MKPTIFSTILFVGILSTMWLAAVNHNAATEEVDYITITPEMADLIRVGMTMEEVVAIIGNPTDTEVAVTPSGIESIRAYWRAPDRQSVYLRFISGQVQEILSKP